MDLGTPICLEFSLSLLVTIFAICLKKTTEKRISKEYTACPTTVECYIIIIRLNNNLRPLRETKKEHN